MTGNRTEVSAFPICPGKEGPIADRFLRYVDGGTDWDLGRCWPWLGGKTSKGYGVFALTHRKQVRAHRFSLEIYSGKPCGAMVLHKCDNPACVNPKHLQNGTHGENMRQMAERRRAAREDRHHNAKMTWNEVVAVNILHKSGDYTTRELATMLGVSQPTIAAIILGRLWPDVHAYADAMLTERSKTGEQS